MTDTRYCRHYFDLDIAPCQYICACSHSCADHKGDNMSDGYPEVDSACIVEGCYCTEYNPSKE